MIGVALLLLPGCNSHAYYDEAKAYVAEAEEVLRDAHVCQGRAPCSVGELVKFEAGGWGLGPIAIGGVSIDVYEVGDRAVADRIVARFRERHKTMPDVPVRLRVYASKHGAPKRLTIEQKVG